MDDALSSMELDPSEQFGIGGDDLESFISFSVVPAAGTPQVSGDDRHWDDSSYYSSGSDISAPPSPSFHDFPYSPTLQNINCRPDIHLLNTDLTSANSPYRTAQQNWSESLSSPELLHPRLGLTSRHRRSQSTDSSHSFRSVGSVSSPGSYFTPLSSAHSSVESLSLDRLEMIDTKCGQHSPESLDFSGPSFSSGTSSEIDGDYLYYSPSPTSPGPSAPGLTSSAGVSIRDMLALLAESGSPITSRDPDNIRRAFLHKLELKEGKGTGANNFSKPTKMEVGTSATLKASKSRRKAEATFFCDLCQAGFTRKNGLINHYRSHLGIADKHCKYCQRGFTTSLTRHMKKCRSNPLRSSDPSYT